jgi:dephospho-CoA kinase
LRRTGLRVLNVGLTGGIGAGKSEVTRRLADLGATVIDADAIAHEVVAKGSEGLAAVVAEFGADVLAGDGSLDRTKLAGLVFTDAGARARLNAIVHPLVGARVAERVTALAVAAPDGIVVHDVPLIVEAGIRDRYDVVVVVDTPVEAQLDRLTRLRGMAPADASARIDAQASRAERLAAADHVIVNDGDLADLDEQVRELWTRLLTPAAPGTGEPA